MYVCMYVCIYVYTLSLIKQVLISLVNYIFKFNYNFHNLKFYLYRPIYTLCLIYTIIQLHIH